MYKKWRLKFDTLKLPNNYPRDSPNSIPYINLMCTTNECIHDVIKLREKYMNYNSPEDSYDNMEEIECEFCLSNLIFKDFVTCKELKDEVNVLLGRKATEETEGN